MMSSSLSVEVCVAFALIFIASRVHKVISALQLLNYTPGMRVPFSPVSLVGAIIPTFWWNPGLHWEWLWRKTAYMNREHELISVIPFVYGVPSYYACSVNVLKQVTNAERQMEKPRDVMVPLLTWGENLISANDDVWKRHRRVVGPAFSPNLYALVVKETISTYREMVSSEGWSVDGDNLVPNFNEIPKKLALIIISRCGFGLPASWADESNSEKPSYGKTLGIVSDTTIPRLIIPNWAYKLPIKALQNIDHTWRKLAIDMDEFVARRNEELSEATIGSHKHGDDIFTRLVSAMDEDSKIGLNKSEVIGNTFALMFAGHETTAHVLSATFGFLAVYQNEQDKGLAEILEVIGKDRDPEADDLSKMPHLLACFHEALRIFPPGVVLFRDIIEDTPIHLTRPKEQVVCLRKGSRLLIDMVGVHHDPQTFPDPETFKPSRWYGVLDTTVSMFGLGPRACIGRKFALTEAVCFLAIFLRDWKIDVALNPGETREQYKERVMMNAAKVGLSFGVGTIPVKLTKRT